MFVHDSGIFQMTCFKQSVPLTKKQCNYNKFTGSYFVEQQEGTKKQK